MDWVRILAYITGTVDQELLLRNEYLAAENRILKAQLKTPLRLTNAERITLAEIAHRLGRKSLEDVANTAKPDTIMGWYRRLVARKFDGSKSRRYPGRPRIDDEVEQWVVRMAKENSDWGYDRIVGAMANLGYTLSDQTVSNILQRHGIPPAPERKRTTTWSDFIRAHMFVLAGTDFFTVEVLTLRGLVTYYVLFFIPYGQKTHPYRDINILTSIVVTSHFFQVRPRQPPCEALSYGYGKGFQVAGSLPSGADPAGCETAGNGPGLGGEGSATGRRDSSSEGFVNLPNLS